MGNHRFKLSDMMPNAWFYKLKDMSRGGRNTSLSQATKKAGHQTRSGGSSTPRQLAAPPQLPGGRLTQPCYQPGRASYYFSSRQQEKLPTSPAHPRASDTLFPVESPRKSQKKAPRKHAAKPSTKLVSSSVSSGCSCRAGIGSGWRTEAIPDFPPAPESPPYGDDHDGIPYSDKPIIAEYYDLDSAAVWSQPCSCRFTASATDIILDVGNRASPAHGNPEPEALRAVPEIDLPPILTKPAAKRDPAPPEPDADGNAAPKEKNFHKPNHCPPLKEHRSSQRRTSSGLKGVRMRTTSPRLASKKLQAHHRHRKAAGSTPRKFLSESCAVVKSSSDPQRDFRDSMVEMIVENNIRTSKDLEELLACYLSLNSNEYHDVIVKITCDGMASTVQDSKCFFCLGSRMTRNNSVRPRGVVWGKKKRKNKRN
ncbi:hypothetical protein Taro_005362 [Colocasia esculenta]|uniref:Transcription repressor n=1 Tax=Colocasia esculenta TaxID=4460 RepID=A0A843TU64_COLES|nr:hypothetical protein [Colocasia esculenta]